MSVFGVAGHGFRFINGRWVCRECGKTLLEVLKDEQAASLDRESQA